MAESGHASPQPARRHSWWTWRIGTVAGIPIRVHVTLLVLVLWIASVDQISGASWTAIALRVTLIAMIFAIIVVHELGHALVARRFGVKTRDILLLPIGGIASLERIPERASQELQVALVGPAINVVVAGLLWIGLAATGNSLDPRDATTIGAALATRFLWINLLLAGFNVIPAFPMDGGRALRALLAMWLGRDRATDIAATCGKLFAAAMVGFGIIYNPFLVLIGIVVWLGAAQERSLVHLKSALTGVPVRAVMVRRVDSVAADQPVADAAALLISAGQNQAAILDHGQPVGAITRSDIATALAKGSAGAPVASVPHHELLEVDVNDPVDDVFDRVRQAPDAVALVVEHGVPVGLLTAEQLAAYAALHAR